MTEPLKYVPQAERRRAATKGNAPSGKDGALRDQVIDAVPSMTVGLAGGKPPAQLQALPGWLIWRFEERDGDTVKVPYYAHGGKRLGRQGDPKDKGQLVTFEAARRAAAAKGFTGVGFATLPEFGITALDFDHVVRDGAVDRDVLAAVAGTYAELSPSGQGVRAFVTGSFDANRKSHANAKQFGVEVFSTKGFVTFTGNALQGSVDAIGERTAAMTALYAQRFGDGTASATSEPVGLALDQAKACLAALDPDITYNEWLQAGMAIHFETDGAIEGLDAWDDWSARGAKYPGRESMEGRWDGFGRSDGAQVTGGTLIKMARAAGAEIGLVAAPSDFAVIPEPPVPAGGHFQIRSEDDFLAQVKPAGWLIKHVLPRHGLGVMYGAPGSGKSFLIFDMACAVSRGIEWNGKRSAKGRVLYVIAEGAPGFAQRIKAYRLKHAATTGLDYLFRDTPNLTDSTSVSNLIADIKAKGPYDLIVMDTLAQVTPGANENSGEDMGRALAHCKKIAQAMNGIVLLVHHSGKDASKGARGHTSLLAACDVEIEVARIDDKRTAEVTKMKDGLDGARFGFELEWVVLGQDEDGEDITSCTVAYNEAAAPRRRKPGKKPTGYDLVASILAEKVGLAVGGTVPQVDLIDACVAQIPHDPAKGDNRKRGVLRAMEQLQADGYLHIDEGVVGLVGPG
jgi:hypothetical protein